jgi:hypothetical protein
MRREPGEQIDDAEFLERGAEIDGGEVAVPIGVDVEGRIARGGELDFFVELIERTRIDRRRELRIVMAGERDPFALERARGFLAGDRERRFDQIIEAREGAAHPDRPVHRTDVKRQPVGDLVEQFEGRLAFAVDLVDEGDDRHRAQAAHLKQLQRLRLDPLGGVDHHHRAVDRGERAIGVLAEILVSRRVEQVEDKALMFEGHHRRGHRNAALLFDLHPVGAGAPRPPYGWRRPQRAAFRSASSCPRRGAR